MIQFSTSKSNRFSITEQAKTAIKGGCRWIEISSSSLNDDEQSIQKFSNEIMPLCKETEAFLIIEDDIDLVESLKVHGVLLRDCTPSVVAHARERLGANAVIGVVIHNFENAKMLKNHDVDYFILDSDEILPMPPAKPDAAEAYADFRGKMDECGIYVHLVARGNISETMCHDLLSKKCCSGVNISTEVTDSDNPVETMKKYLVAAETATM